MADDISIGDVETVTPPGRRGEPVPKELPLDQAKAVASPEPKPKGPGINQWHAQELEMENQLLGPSQFTSPNIEDHKKNYLGEAYVDERGRVQYMDEDNNIKDTNTSKHVMMRDPEDGKYKVFSRTAQTDADSIPARLAGLGHFYMQGSGAGALPMTAAPSAAGKTMEAIQALKGATGVGVSVPQTAVGGPLNNLVARGVGAIPGGAAPFQRASATMAGDLGAATKAASELPTGVAATPEMAGEAAKTGLTNYVKPKGVLAKKVSAAYDKVDATVDQTATHDLNRTRDIAQKILDERAAAKLTDTPKYITQVMNALTDPEGLTYAGLKKLRSFIGEEQGAASGSDLTDLKRLYRGLSDDMRELVTDKGGQRGLQLWNRATFYAGKAADRTEKLQTLLGTRSDEGVFAKLISMSGNTTTANAKLLATARKALQPDEWAEVASGAVGRLGLKQMGNENVFDPNKFLKDYGRVSDRGKALLFGESGDLRQSLDSIAEISAKWNKQAPLAHPSGEISHLAGVLGIFHAPLVAISTILGAGTVSSMLSRPLTARAVLKFSEAANELRMRPTPATMNAYTQALRAVNIASQTAGEPSRDLPKEWTTPIDTREWTQDKIKKLKDMVGLPGYAEGGRPEVGQPAIVGENGPEIFVPDQPGTVVPSEQAAQRLRQGVQSPARYNPPVNNQVDMGDELHNFRNYLMGDQGKDVLKDLYSAYWGMAAKSGVPNPFTQFPKATAAKIGGALTMLPTEAKGGWKARIKADAASIADDHHMRRLATKLAPVNVEE